MDISVIKTNKTNKDNGIFIGDLAPKQLLEFINVRCPYCKKWFEESRELLNEAVNANKIQRIIKLIDRPKESLQRGNVMHRFVTTDHAQQTLADLTKIFATQAQWGNLSLEEVAEFAKNELHLSEHNHLEYAQKLVEETEQATIKFVPTIVIGDHIFDENIDQETLTGYID
ncbi:hypothetical protein DOK78_002249 [Enterococcus sp. DIV2402]|uniref:Thioredoxin-like fold domain-containing protein n=1 Tax=Candidatus Enterococcus lowellii TaxID=2230877 RepID=A0ABZ2SPA1_9ENTE|nr:thioredoxin domain-containing protein [Enterococcus sp. DIV2402]MBO0463631.1 DsbA family protein [Enterococcus sp. DIV2402]